MGIISRIFKRGAAPAVSPEPVPERPPEWSHTVAMLMEEMAAGGRESVSGTELRWARDYERSLIPPGYRFPRKGDVYEALADMEVEYITDFAGPFSGGGRGVLKKGERVRLNREEREEKPVGAFAVPVNYGEIEARMVPADERRSPKYGSMSFYFTTMELNTAFGLVDGGGDGMKINFLALLAAPLAVPLLCATGWAVANSGQPLAAFLIAFIVTALISYPVTLFLFAPTVFLLFRRAASTGPKVALVGLLIGLLSYFPISFEAYMASGPNSGPPEGSYFGMLAQWGMTPLIPTLGVAGLVTAWVYWLLAKKI